LFAQAREVARRRLSLITHRFIGGGGIRGYGFGGGFSERLRVIVIRCATVLAAPESQ
jgi:hypothetical protein